MFVFPVLFWCAQYRECYAYSVCCSQIIYTASYTLARQSSSHGQSQSCRDFPGNTCTAHKHRIIGFWMSTNNDSDWGCDQMGHSTWTRVGPDCLRCAWPNGTACPGGIAESSGLKNISSVEVFVRTHALGSLPWPSKSSHAPAQGTGWPIITWCII